VAPGKKFTIGTSLLLIVELKLVIVPTTFNTTTPSVGVRLVLKLILTEILSPFKNGLKLALPGGVRNNIEKPVLPLLSTIKSEAVSDACPGGFASKTIG
jgi:hypothetical protein